MIIKDIGPIKEAQIQISPLTIFFGDNGTGKTLAQYSLFAFLDWLESNYNKLSVISKKALENIILNDEAVELSIEEMKISLSKEIVERFNSLDAVYFENFFKDNNVYRKNVSSISIDEEDVKSVLEYGHIGSLGGFNWPFSHENGSDEDDQVGIQDEMANSLRIEASNNKLRVTYRTKNQLGGKTLSNEDKERQVSEKARVPFSFIHRFFNRNIIATLVGFKNVYLPAERVGINTFRIELINNRISAIDNFNDLNEDELSQDKMDYPRPINSYMTFTSRQLSPRRENNMQEVIEKFTDELIPGKFEYDEESDAVFFNMKTGQTHLSFKLLSSSLKSLYGLERFLKVSSKGDSLFIDEPEMNLHPKRQVIIMELLYELVRSGYNRVVVSTHSDYLVKKLINLMLADEKNDKLHNPNVGVYYFKSGTVKKIDRLTDENSEGTINFDATSISLNEEYYSLID